MNDSIYNTFAVSMVIQTLIFSKSTFKTSEEAKKWASSHKFKSGNVRETGDSWRLQQRPPEEFDSATFRTVSITDGVTAVMGKLKNAKADITEEEFVIMSTVAFIRKVGNQYCVFSHDGSKRLGCYNSKEAAVKRLQQIEMFKHMK